MTTYNKDRLKLVSQGITGGKVWHYHDTGALADVVDVAGFFANAGDMGVDSGDLLFVRASDGGLTRVVHGVGFTPVMDTGTTQAGTGPGTLIGDTG